MKNIERKGFWAGALKALNVGWKVALIVVGLFTMVILVAAGRNYCGNHYGKHAHYWDMDLSKNTCVHRFSNGTKRAYNREAGKYVTPRMQWVASAPERDSLTVFCDKDGKRGFLNVNTGEIVVEGKYRHAWVFSEGLAAVVEPNGKMGFINHEGEYVIQPELDYISSHDYVFKHGVCCIQSKDEKFGLLSREGKWVLTQEYDYIDYEGGPDVFIPRKDDKYGAVQNGSFDWVYPLEYDYISWNEGTNGDAFLLYKDHNTERVTLDGTVVDRFVIDETREMRYMTVYHPDIADEYAISDKVLAFRVYSKWGVMDKHTGKVLIPAMYGSVDLSSESIIECSFEDYGCYNYVLYDLKGNKIE